MYSDPSGESLIAACIIIGVAAFIACASPAGQARTQAAFSDPNLYTVGNWLTLGTFDTLKGTFNSEKPLSLEHWVDSLGTATMVFPLLNGASKAVSSYKLANSISKSTISVADSIRIQNAANRTGQQITVIGSRAKGTATLTKAFSKKFFT